MTTMKVQKSILLNKHLETPPSTRSLESRGSLKGRVGDLVQNLFWLCWLKHVICYDGSSHPDSDCQHCRYVNTYGQNTQHSHSDFMDHIYCNSLKKIILGCQFISERTIGKIITFQLRLQIYILLKCYILKLYALVITSS